MEKKSGDLFINGIGSSNGGSFEEVTINGIGTVNSDIDCSLFDCNGVGTVKGSIRSEKAKVNGRVKIKGALESQELSIEGAVKIDENLTIKKLRASGRTVIDGSVKGEKVQIKGLFKVNGDCEAEIIQVESHLSIGGLLSADEINLKLYGECRAKEIGGQTITVRGSRGSLVSSLLKPFKKTQLITDLIEGDQINLKSTSAKIVRGRNVKIGPDCNIGVVEYTGDISVANNTIVGETRKV